MPYQRLEASGRPAPPGRRGRHYSYLSDGGADPRPEILSRLKAELGRKGSIVAYNASFERRVLGRCAERFPRFTQWFESICPRIVDLLAPFRDLHYYHPDQLGSASLKAILPAITGISYGDLPISDGETASLRFLDLAFGNLPAAEKAGIRSALKTYCRQDTEGMSACISVDRRFQSNSRKLPDAGMR